MNSSLLRREQPIRVGSMSVTLIFRPFIGGAMSEIEMLRQFLNPPAKQIPHQRLPGYAKLPGADPKHRAGGDSQPILGMNVHDV
jgi:hypothetical protein